jgi:hypothetical protein
LEEFGDGTSHTDQVIAAVPSGAENDFAAMERIECLSEDSPVQSRGIGSDDDGSLESFLLSKVEGTGQSVTEISSLLGAAG